jgi:O-antigen ligase
MYFVYVLFNGLYYQLINNVVIIGSKNDESSVLALLFPVLMFALIKGGIKTLSQLRVLYFILICAIIISSIDFWLVYLKGPLNPVDDVVSLDSIYQKASGISHQVNSLAHYISYLMPILLLGLFYPILLLSRQQLMYCLIFYAITLIWLSSRSGILLTIILFGIILFLNKGVKIRYKIALVLCLASGFIFAINQNLPIVERFLLGEESGDIERFEKIAQAFSLFQESPIFGSGFGSFIVLNNKISGSTLNTHNTLLSVLVEQGIVGLFFFLTLFLTPIVYFWKFKTFYSNYMLRFNRMVITSLFLVFFGFFFDHHHGDVFYYILIAAATNSVLAFNDLKIAHNNHV